MGKKESGMKLRVNHIGGIGNRYNRAGIELEINCMMTEGQMLDAILTFLEHVPGPKWEEWKAIIDSDNETATKRA